MAAMTSGVARIWYEGADLRENNLGVTPQNQQKDAKNNACIIQYSVGCTAELTARYAILDIGNRTSYCKNLCESEVHCMIPRK